ncbi:MAG: hypothetical protein GEV08_01920 [Acidimicrobiia bacterium]|nr:hypothetical protein [Acidimicrobiia bacterium]
MAAELDQNDKRVSELEVLTAQLSLRQVSGIDGERLAAAVDQQSLNEIARWLCPVAAQGHAALWAQMPTVVARAPELTASQVGALVGVAGSAACNDALTAAQSG